jgi:inorganic pyrophosphatase
MTSYSKPFLGKEVIVMVDRPLDTKHPKHEYTYPVNYGYIKGVKAPDGEDLDAYILGITTPLEEFRGVCIAIIHRTNDDDDKLIVCSEDKTYSDEEIRELTNFQEQWFKSEIIRNA